MALEPTKLSIGMTITMPGGAVLSLENAVGGYELHADTRNQMTVSLRKQEISSSYVEGTFVTQAVRDTVTETVAVWVSGDNDSAVDYRVDQLLSAYGQLQFTMVFTQGSVTETWACQPAEYVVEYPREQRFARMALVRAQIPRSPTAKKLRA